MLLTTPTTHRPTSVPLNFEDLESTDAEEILPEGWMVRRTHNVPESLAEFLLREHVRIRPLYLRKVDCT